MSYGVGHPGGCGSLSPDKKCTGLPPAPVGRQQHTSFPLGLSLPRIIVNRNAFPDRERALSGEEQEPTSPPGILESEQDRHISLLLKGLHD